MENFKKEIKMLRYHKELYFPENDLQNLKKFIDGLNAKKFSFSIHAFDKIKERLTDFESLGYYLKDLTFQYENIFEYYKENDLIVKAVFRFNYDKGRDLIIVINEYKKVITIYFNSLGDNHYTLNPENYCTKGLTKV